MAKSALTFFNDCESLVLSQYRCSVTVGQMLLFSSNWGMKYSFIALPGWPCLGGERSKAMHPQGENQGMEVETGQFS